MRKKTLPIFLAVVLFTGLIPFLEEAIERPELKMAPLNPEFIKYLNDKENSLFKIRSVLPAGKLPSPVDLSHIKGKKNRMKTAAFPAAFDLRNQGKLTPVKNQGSCGACWAFGTYASMESCLLPGEETDFSEVDMIQNHGFDYNPCDGGTEFMSVAYLARWGGPVPESDMPYNYSSFSSGNEGLVHKHVQRIVFLPERENFLDNDTIKSFVTSSGAVAVSMYIDEYSEYYNRENAAYYCGKHHGINHMVAVVGWNDNYPADKFKISPPGNGAFIIKNSWGTQFGEEGYFYMSYYDTTLSWPVIFNNAEEYTNYGANYQYDPLGWHSNWGYDDTTAWSANIFQAAGNQPAQAVGFYVSDTDVNYQVYVYKGVTGNNPRSGSLKAAKSGTFLYPGFYTVKLDAPVSLNKGQLFSVVLKLENSSYNYPIAMEFPLDGYSSEASANAGESFTSHNGTDWEDVTIETDNANVCLKAFAGFSEAILNVAAKRETVFGWLVSRDVGRISIRIENMNEVSISKIIIYKRMSPLSPYSSCKEILPGELQNGSYSYTDFDLDGEKTHYYKVAVLNDSGVVCSRSDEKTI
jgi:C1A family cysteine protease